VESILNSGLSPEIYEVILIDDGSTDGTEEVGEALSLKFPQVFYFRQENKGVAAARNYGLSLAQNKFVWFIDADDIVKSNLLLDLLYMIVDNDLDAIGMNFYGIEENGKPLPKTKGKLIVEGKKIISGGEFYRYNYKRSYIWQYIFRKDIFHNHQIKFNEDMIMEDSEVLPRIMANIYRIGIYENPVYGYRRRNTSLLRTKSSESELLFMNSAIILAKSIKEQVKLFSAYTGLAEGLIKKSVQVNQILFLKYIGGEWSNEQREEFVSAMRKSGVFPFTKIANLSPLMNLRLNAWRIIINLSPVQSSRLYKKIN
jgi:glycosyltransferase involved in cell wall biosynthesis